MIGLHRWWLFVSGISLSSTLRTEFLWNCARLANSLLSDFLFLFFLISFSFLMFYERNHSTFWSSVTYSYIVRVRSPTSREYIFWNPTYQIIYQLFTKISIYAASRRTVLMPNSEASNGSWRVVLLWIPS